MSEKKFDVYWNSYTDHLREMLQQMRSSEELTDVTLICDDKKQIKAHKNILGASSSKFKTIVNELPIANSVIYLRGINYEEMEAILEYIYLGAVTIQENKIEEFLETAKNLDLKEIGNRIEEQPFSTSPPENENIEETNSEQYREGPQNLEIRDISGNVDFQMKEETDDEEEIEIEEIEEGMEPIIEFNDEIDESNLPVMDSKQCPATECNKLFATTQTMIAHYQKKHKDSNLFCLQCNYKTANKQNLRVHILSKHEGFTFDCTQCDYKASHRHWLKNHIETKHNGFRYSCDQCDYAAAFKSSLYNHVQARHEDVKYSCNLCDHQLNSKNSLAKHKKYKHDGLC